MTVVSASAHRVQTIINNLEISFINCRFIYSKLDHITNNGIANSKLNIHESATPTNCRRKSTLASIQKFVHNASDRLLDIGSSAPPTEDPYMNCIFPPGDDEVVKDQITIFQNEHAKFKFTNCIFIKREFNFIEDLIRKFKKLLGVRFELNFASGTVEIEKTKFKLKDIPWISQIVVQQIQEEQAKES